MWTEKLTEKHLKYLHFSWIKRLLSYYSCLFMPWDIFLLGNRAIFKFEDISFETVTVLSGDHLRGKACAPWLLWVCPLCEAELSAPCFSAACRRYTIRPCDSEWAMLPLPPPQPPSPGAPGRLPRRPPWPPTPQQSLGGGWLNSVSRVRTLLVNAPESEFGN